MKTIRHAALAALAATALSSGAATAADSLSIALNANIGAAYPLYVCTTEGVFEKAGIDLRILKLENPGLINNAVLSGDADLAVAASSAGFFNTAANGDLRILAAGNLAKPGYAAAVIVVSTEAYEKGLKTPADLAGKRIGISTKGSAADFAIYKLGKQHGFQVTPQMIVPLGSMGNSAAALKAGSIDALSGGSGALTASLEKTGQGRIIWNESVETRLATAVYAKTDVIEKKRDTLVKFFRGYLACAKLFGDGLGKRNDKGEFVATTDSDRMISEIAAQVKQSKEDIIASITYLPPDGRFNPAEIPEAIAIWQSTGFLDAKIDTVKDKIVDFSLLDEAAKGR